MFIGREYFKIFDIFLNNLIFFLFEKVKLIKVKIEMVVWFFKKMCNYMCLYKSVCEYV